MSHRSNGLPGQDWEALTVLAPPAADHVLDALRDEGIAAYATPRGRGGSSLLSQGNDAMSVPLDQVFVNADDVDRARVVLDALLPELEAEPDPAGDASDEAPQTAAASGEPASRPSEDEIWAGIVAAYGEPAAEPDRAVAANAPDAPLAERPPADDTGPLTPHRPATGFEDVAEAVAAERRARDEVDEADQARAAMRDEHDHYVPPPPPPIPAGDSVTRLAWIGVLGGPLWLVLATILGWGPGGLPGLVAVLAFVGGFVTLITRLDHDRPDDGDDGAVV